MIKNPWMRHSIVVLLVLFLGVIGCAAFAYQVLWTRYDAALQQLEPRSERLDGVVAAGEDIEAQSSSVGAMVSPWLHPGGDSAQNDIQQRLRQMISSSGSTLVSSQVALEAGAEGKLARIRVTATVSGEWQKLVGLMESLQMHRPPFWVRAATITREGASSGGGGQSARLALQLEAPLVPEKAKP